MTRETFEDWIFKCMGGIAILICCFSTFPQVYKMYKTKKTNDVAILSLISLFTGTLMFSIYAYYFGLWEVFIPNCVTLLMVTIQLILKKCFDKNKLTQERLMEHENHVQVLSPSVSNILDNPDELYYGDSKNDLENGYKRSINEDFKAY